MRPILLTTILAAMTGCGEPYTEMTVCISVSEDAQVCPLPEEVNKEDAFAFLICEIEVKEITGEGVIGPHPYDWGSSGLPDDDTMQACCYPAEARDVSPNCNIGRPYTENKTPLVANVRIGSAWIGEAPSGQGPIDARLSQAWLAIAQMEHASVAAFAKLTLDLLALGAPHDLLAEVQAASADEVEHAKLCFQLASRFGGKAFEAKAMEFTTPIRPCTDLVEVAVAAVREGCLGETIGAWLVSHSAEKAMDPQVKAALTRIAKDETQHAGLSWKLVKWLIQEGGEEVRSAVVEAFQAPFEVETLMPGQGNPAYGILSVDDHVALCARVQREVLGPAIQTLLAA